MRLVSEVGAATLALLFALPVLAEPVNCDNITHSRIPYELKVRNHKGGTAVSEIYRHENLYKTQITKAKSGLFRTVYQANFVKEMQSADGKQIRFEYSVPTDKYIYDQNAAEFRWTSIVDGVTVTSGVSHVKFFKDEVISLSSCTFVSKHYAVDTTLGAPNGASLHLELWIAEGLDAVIRSKRTITLAGKATDEFNVAVDVSEPAFRRCIRLCHEGDAWFRESFGPCLHAACAAPTPTRFL